MLNLFSIIRMFFFSFFGKQNQSSVIYTTAYPNTIEQKKMQGLDFVQICPVNEIGALRFSVQASSRFFSICVSDMKLMLRFFSVKVDSTFIHEIWYINDILVKNKKVSMQEIVIQKAGSCVLFNIFSHLGSSQNVILSHDVFCYKIFQVFCV